MRSLFDILPQDLFAELFAYLPYYKIKFITDNYLTDEQFKFRQNFIFLKFLQHKFPLIYSNIIEPNFNILNDKHSDNKIDLEQLIDTLLKLQSNDSYILNGYRVDPSDEDNTAIVRASEYGYKEVVELLLSDDRVDPSDRRNEAIILASLNGHIEVVELLLSDGRVDPSDLHNYAIRWASRNGQHEVVELLLSDDRVDPSDKHNEAIRWASQYGHKEVVEFLLFDERVKNSLSTLDYNKYLKIIS